jgi:hypothetical protein
LHNPGQSGRLCWRTMTTNPTIVPVQRDNQSDWLAENQASPNN